MDAPPPLKPDPHLLHQALAQEAARLRAPQAHDAIWYRAVDRLLAAVERLVA